MAGLQVPPGPLPDILQHHPHEGGKAYRATNVKHIDWQKISKGHTEDPVVVGIDVGKYELIAVARWEDGWYERPWQVWNPGQLEDFVALPSYFVDGWPKVA